MTLRGFSLLALSLLVSHVQLADSDAVSVSNSASSAKDDGASASSSSSSDSSSWHSSSLSSDPGLPETLSEMGSVIPGVYKEYLPQPIFYEFVVPVIFPYQTPLWNKTEITFNNWYTCISETVPYRYSCPVTFHMNKAIVNLHVDFERLHPISDIRLQSLQESMKLYYDLLTGHSEFCDKIQKHFAGIWTESSTLQKYLNALQLCSRGQDLHPIIHSPFTDYNYSIRQPFTKMENNFYNTFYKLILGSGGKNSSLDLVASALLSNTRTSLQGAVLGQYYAEKNRWVHASQDCRQSFIPTSLLTPEKLNESLSAILKMNVFVSNQSDLSVPPGQMSKYYSLPLADCTHTADSFVVRVLIPILKRYRGKILSLVHVHTIPFQYKDHICRVKLPHQTGSNKVNTEDGIIGDRDSSFMYLYHELSHRAYPTTCKPNELCKISEYSLDSRRSDPCVSALLSRNDTGIRTHCDFECLPKEDYVMPSVVRVASNKFVVTGNSVTLRIACGKYTKKEKVVYIQENHIGAMLVKLSCHCRLILPHFNVFYGGRSCDPDEELGNGHYTRIVNSDEDPNYEPDELTVTSIIPFMFGKVKSVQDDHQGKSNGNLLRPDDDMDYESFHYDSLAEGDILNLTKIIDVDRIENYIRSSEIRRKQAEKEKGFKGMDFYAEKLHSGESLYDNGHSNGGAGGMFWSVFIISLIVVLTLQVYIIVMFKRFQKVSYYKEDRILYRAEPDTASLGWEDDINNKSYK